MASILGIKAASKIDAGETFDLVSTVKPVPLPVVVSSSQRQRPVVKRSGNDEADGESSGEGGDELSGREGSVVDRHRLGACYSTTCQVSPPDRFSISIPRSVLFSEQTL